MSNYNNNSKQPHNNNSYKRVIGSSLSITKLVFAFAPIILAAPFIYILLMVFFSMMQVGGFMGFFGGCFFVWMISMLLMCVIGILSDGK